MFALFEHISVAPPCSQVSWFEHTVVVVPQKYISHLERRIGKEERRGVGE